MTPERFDKLRSVLAARQPDLTVLMDQVNKSHNFSAILRNCDAVGVYEAHAVLPSARPELHLGVSAGTARWVPVTPHESTAEAVAYLRGAGFRVLAAHLSDRAVDYRDVDYTRPLALMMGSELYGVSDDGLDEADEHVVIPMKGLVQSLNVSVATALLLFEAQRQRLAAGMYDESRLDPEAFTLRLFEWAYPREAEVFRARGEPYPELDENGNWIDG